MYTITIEKSGVSGCGAYDTPNTNIKSLGFASAKEAKKELRRMVKRDGFKCYAGTYANFSEGLEVSTNF